MANNSIIMSREAAIINNLSVDAETVDKVNKYLLNAMEQVKGNTAYIEQAEAMCSLSQRIVEGLKVKVTAAALMARALEK